MIVNYVVKDVDKAVFPEVIEGKRVNILLDMIAVLSMGTRTSLSPS